MTLIKNGSVKLSGIGIVLFLAAMYSVSTIAAITGSWTYTAAVLLLSVLVLMLSGSGHIQFAMNASVLMLLFITVCGVAGAVQNGSYIDAFFYFACAAVLTQARNISVKSLYSSLRIMVFLALVFALSCYWQLLFKDQYMKTVFPLFGKEYQETITRLLKNGASTGLTGQTSVVSQFIMMGIMSVIFSGSMKKSNKNIVIGVFELIFFVGAIILTARRSPILDFVAAYFVVYIVTRNRKIRRNRMATFLLVLLVISLLIYFVVPAFSSSRNALTRIIKTIKTGKIEVILNDRLDLYENAVSELTENPMFGIGWGTYGIRYDASGVHNIYLQLLCECGIVIGGLIIYLIFHIFAKTIRRIKKVAALSDPAALALYKCSLFIQTYFLAYGLFENPLYDKNYVLMYAMGLLMKEVVEFEFRTKLRSGAVLNGGGALPADGVGAEAA